MSTDNKDEFYEDIASFARDGFYEDLALFNGVTDPLLRAFNRAVMVLTLQLCVSERVILRYMQSFIPDDIAAIKQMMTRIERGEANEIKKKVKFRCNWTDNDDRRVYHAWVGNLGVGGKKWNWY